MYARKTSEIVLYNPSTSCRLHLVLKQLRHAVETSEAYSEEAIKAGAVEKLAKFLKRSSIAEDEASFDDISAIIAACSGPMATGTRIRSCTYPTSDGRDITVQIKEGALGDGVGAKLWTVAHVMCREITTHPSLVQGKSVLELGAGCGAPGFVASKLGATETVLTDYVDVLLNNLRDALHLNFPLSTDATGNDGTDDGSPHHNVNTATVAAYLCGEFDPEDDNISECSDLDAFLADGGSSSSALQSTTETAWRCGGTSVRFLDWNDSVVYLEHKERRKRKEHGSMSRAASQLSIASSTVSSAYSALDGESSRSIAPGIPMQKRFDVVLGTDCLYEWHMAESLAAAVAHRLKWGGIGLLCGAVRDQAMFDALVENLEKRGLRVGVNHIEPSEEDMGVVSENRYEGGFVLVAIEHREHPAGDGWHRDDLFG